MAENYVLVQERTETVIENGGEVNRVWYRIAAPAALEAAPAALEVKPGHWIVMLARVNAARESGGYRTGSPPPGMKRGASLVEKATVEKGIEFRFDQSEIYVVTPEALEDYGIIARKESDS